VKSSLVKLAPRNSPTPPSSAGIVSLSPISPEAGNRCGLVSGEFARPEQRVAATAFENMLLAGEFQAGLADPGPVDGGVGVAPPHGGSHLPGSYRVSKLCRRSHIDHPIRKRKEKHLLS
jgi:hypothetical protein